MPKPGAMPHETEPPAHYLFIVARNRPDILARVKERLHGDVRIEIIADRRYGERRKSAAPTAPDQRRAERRRPTKHWDDLSVYPTLVVQKRVESYAELQHKVARLETLAAENRELCADNARLRDEIGGLEKRLEELISADAAFRAETATILAQAEQAVGAMIARFEVLSRGQGSESQPRVPRG